MKEMLKKLIGDRTKWIVVPMYLIYFLLCRYFNLGCIWLRLTGVICPGCGYTRALKSVLRLDFASAFRWHPMFWTFPILVLLFLRDGRMTKCKWFNILVLTIIGIGFLISWIARIGSSYMFME